jgi:hypothetical protein
MQDTRSAPGLATAPLGRLWYRGRTVATPEELAVPLLDHFHPPLSDRYQWESFHSNWATRLADALNERLPAEFFAEEHAHVGTSLEVDVATFERAGDNPPEQANGNATATQVWTPPAPPRTMPAVFPDRFEVRVISTAAGPVLVAAIELVSPGNKDRPEERRAFAAKCASYLHQGVSVIVIDIVTNRRANLHNETVRLMQAAEEFFLPPDTGLYAVSYRPVLRGERPAIDFWPEPLAVGTSLPVLPLRLTGDLFVPVDFETTYQEACRRRRLT